MKNASVQKLASKYKKTVHWSDEDNCFVGALPEICGNCCHGDTEEEVMKLLEEIALDYAQDELGVYGNAIKY